MFDRTVEQTLRLGLEGASFITAYDRSRIRSIFGVQPPETMDETSARELATTQNVAVVVAPALEAVVGAFELSLRVLRTASGESITELRSRVANRADIVTVATSLAISVRRALGDRTPESDQLFDMGGLPSTSSDVVSLYASAMNSQSRGRYEEANQTLLKAITIDPSFGLAYQALAATSRNLGRLQEADRHVAEALRHLDSMTVRERSATRGLFYRLRGDYQQCVREFSESTKRYAGNAIAHNQHALCLSKLRALRQAIEEMRRAVEIFPKHPVFRANLAIYTAYAGDFALAEREVEPISNVNDLAKLVVAFAQIGRGNFKGAHLTYEQLAQLGSRGASWSASGLADIAIVEGRFSDAAKLLDAGASADLATMNPDRAARKLTAQAHAFNMIGRRTAALQSAKRALELSRVPEVQLLAAKELIEAGDTILAGKLSESLTRELPAEPHAFGRIIDGLVARRNGDPRQAIRLLIEANEIVDTWLGHYELGLAYLGAGEFPQADSEFDRCIQRQGEAISLLLDEEPTYGYFPEVYYHQGLVRERLRNARFADSYRAYLLFRGASHEDQAARELSTRLGS
jgi:tetratricopeptide (TPR) repeat protein